MFVDWRRRFPDGYQSEIRPGVNQDARSERPKSNPLHRCASAPTKDAHSAEADTVATFEILKAQILRYENVSMVSADLKEVFPVCNDMEQLHKFTSQNTADLSGRIVYNKAGREVFNFGKHKNVPVEDVLAKEPSYYDWMMKGEFPLYTKKVLTKIKLRGVTMFKA